MKYCLSLFAICTLTSLGFGQVEINAFEKLPGETDFEALQRNRTERLGGEVANEGLLITLGSGREAGAELSTFYSTVQSFVMVVAKEKRNIGTGWSIEKADRTELEKSLKAAMRKRQELLTEASELKNVPDALWKKVFEAEVKAEDDICSVLLSALPPDELEIYIRDHISDLSECLMTSKAFFELAEVDKEARDKLREIRLKYLGLKSKAIGKTHTDQSFESLFSLAEESLGLIEPEAFRLALVMSGQVKSADTLEMYFASVEPDAAKRLVKANPKFSRFVAKRAR
jgi:hypothetical protein